MGFYLLLQLYLLVATVEALSSQPPVTTKPGCPNKCGNISIPYPFGIGDSCNIGGGSFNISCNTTFQPPKPYMGELEVLNTTLISGLMRILNYIGYRCYTNTGKLDLVWKNWMNLDESQPFTFSETHNKLTAIGCDTIASITGFWGRDFKSGCMSFCNDRNSVINGSCSGIGCCQTAIPNAFKSFEVTLDSVSNHKNVSSFNPCSYAFLVEKDAFSFNESDLIGFNFLDRSESIPVVLDWAISNETCEMARKDLASFACVSENSTCYESTDGYRCNCSEGYEGNPYLIGGCQDIDECKENYVKKLCQQNCINLPGNYSCSCWKGYHGLYDDQRECIKDTHKFPAIAVVLGNPSIPISIIVQEPVGRLETWSTQLGIN
ncbi:wall-associated receptor kinase 2-like [Magnolia sinica]|uniref:wall-associated receptor kinase 2-like n=1 Tax=Magnolia sinica TaxID=86752 RepID=UPI002658DA31|nr:wall-associated receptor kinase 2-like [Magnolia sinica]